MQPTLELLCKRRLCSLEEVWVDTMLARASRNAKCGDPDGAVQHLSLAQYCYPYNGLIKQSISFYITLLRRLTTENKKISRSRRLSLLIPHSPFGVIKATYLVLSTVFVIYAFSSTWINLEAREPATYIAELSRSTDPSTAEITYQQAKGASSTTPFIVWKPKTIIADSEYRVVVGPFFGPEGASDACANLKGLYCRVQELTEIRQ